MKPARFGPFQQGETITFRAVPFVGVIADVVGLPTGLIKKLRPGRSFVPGDATPPQAIFAVSLQPAVGSLPQGWEFTLSAAVTQALPAASYIADALFVLSNGKTISRPVRFTLEKGVTIS